MHGDSVCFHDRNICSNIRNFCKLVFSTDKFWNWIFNKTKRNAKRLDMINDNFQCEYHLIL